MSPPRSNNNDAAAAQHCRRRHGIRAPSVILLFAVALCLIATTSSARPDWAFRGAKAVQDRPLAMLSRLSNAARQLSLTSLALSPAQMLAWLKLNVAAAAGYLSDVTGVCSTAIQMVETYKAKDSENLSMDMFIQRLAADFVCFAGSLMCNEPIQNKFLNGFYIFETISFMSLAIYFTCIYKHSDPSLQHKPRAGPMFTPKWIVMSSVFLSSPVVMYLLGGKLGVPAPVLVEMVGTLCLWGSGLLYFFSRIPQMQQVWASGNVHGLNPWSTIATITSNLLMGTCILMQNLRDHVPLSTMLIGSSAAIFVGTYGVTALDLIYIYIFAVLGGRRAFLRFGVPDDDAIAAPADENGEYALLMDDCCPCPEELPKSTVTVTELDQESDAGAVSSSSSDCDKRE